MTQSKVQGVGLGFRREMADDLESLIQSDIDFFEVAPENWMRLGGQFQAMFENLSQAKTIVTHGLSLSIGSPDPLDVEFVKEVGQFLKQYNIACYTEHLSYCSANGHMYDLMPIPFTEEAVKYVSQRIRQVQDILEQPIAMENVSYYVTQASDMTELEFTQAVLEEADCKLLFDVNNIYVNSINHKYDAKEFIRAMPTERILYGHIAGHYDEASDLKVDTHGADVIDPVWKLLEYAYQTHGVFPTLLERDFNIPPFAELIKETQTIRDIQHKQKLRAAS